MSDAVSEPGGQAEPAPPRAIEELALACVQYVEHAVRTTLDFSSETLTVLDHYLQTAGEGVRGRPELLPLVTRAVGAYFGEVVRGKIPSFWLIRGGDAHDWRLCARTVFLSFNPVGAAYDALYRSTDHDGPSSQLVIAPEERSVVERRLSLLPEMGPEEFYLLTTRFEAIEIAADALRAQMIEDGVAGVEFDESDYTGQLGES